MRAVALTLVAVAGIYWSVRIHQADAAYRSVRDIDPDTAPPSERELRLERLSQAIETDALDPLYRFRRGGSFFAEGTSEGYRRAVDEFREAARIAPSWFEPQFWWGMSLLALGNDEDENFAVSRLDRSRELAPYNVDLNERLGRYWARRWIRSRRIEHLRRAFESVHDLRLVEPESTLKALAPILASPVVRFADLDAMVSRDDVEERRTLARALDEANRFRWSIRVHEEVRERLGDDTFSDWLELARARLELRDDDAALDALRRHVERLEPDLATAVTDVEQLFHVARRPDVGRRFCREASERWPEAIDLVLLEGEFALRDDDPNGALDAYQRYRDRRAEDPRAYSLAARCYEALGDLDLALTHIRLALDLRPKSERDRAVEARLIRRGAK